MNKNKATALRIVLGLYLAFLGGQLMYDVVKAKPTDMVFKCAMAAAFLIIGAGYMIWSIRGVIDFSKWKKTKKTKPEETKDKKIYRRPVTDKTTYRTAPMPTMQEIRTEMKASGSAESEKESAGAPNVTVDLTMEEDLEDNAAVAVQGTEERQAEKEILRAAGAESEGRGVEPEKRKVGTENPIGVYPGSMEQNAAVVGKEDTRDHAEAFSVLPIEIEDLTGEDASEEYSADTEFEENDYEEK